MDLLTSSRTPCPYREHLTRSVSAKSWRAFCLHFLLNASSRPTTRKMNDLMSTLLRPYAKNAIDIEPETEYTEYNGISNHFAITVGIVLGNEMDALGTIKLENVLPLYDIAGTTNRACYYGNGDVHSSVCQKMQTGRFRSNQTPVDAFCKGIFALWENVLGQKIGPLRRKLSTPHQYCLYTR
jgi:hypothetical protein